MDYGNSLQVDKNDSNKNLIYRGNCPICSRFLFKFIDNGDFTMFMRCTNCKNVSSYIKRSTVISIGTLYRHFRIEPEGNISTDEINRIFEAGYKKDI